MSTDDDHDAERQDCKNPFIRIHSIMKRGDLFKRVGVIDYTNIIPSHM